MMSRLEMWMKIYGSNFWYDIMFIWLGVGFNNSSIVSDN